MLRSMVALLGLVIAVVGCLMFLAVGIGVWRVKEDVDRQAKTLSGRANETLNSAGKAVGYVQEIIKKAKTDLDATRERLAKEPPATVSPIVRMTAEKASQDLAGSVDRAHNAVLLASEAVVVADAALSVVDANQELRKILGVKPEQLDASHSALGRVSGELQQARDVLGVPISSNGEPTNEQLQAVDDALRQGQAFIDEVNAVVESTRTRVNEAKRQVDVWSWRAAFAASVLSAFGVVGQLFMGRYFWRCMG
jgi:hydrogenase maturation protease